MTNDEIEAVKQAVADGIRDVLKDEEAVREFWSGAFYHLQRHAQQQTGRLLLGGLWAFLQRLALFLLLGLVIYSVGGWAAVTKLWHALELGL